MMFAKNQVVEQNEETYQFRIEYLPEEFRLKAEMELNETPFSSDYFLQELKSLAKSKLNIFSCAFTNVVCIIT